MGMGAFSYLTFFTNYLLRQSLTTPVDRNTVFTNYLCISTQRSLHSLMVPGCWSQIIYSLLSVPERE